MYYLLDRSEDLFKFINEGKLHDLIQLFIFLRKINPLSFIKDKNFDESTAS